MFIIFDSECNLCLDSIHFIVKNDERAKFKFLKLQSQLAQNYLENYGIDPKTLNSIVLIKNDHIYLKSDAAVEIAKHLDGKYQKLAYLRFVPKFLRDSIYSYIAKNRYKLFGKCENCDKLTQEIENRFLKK